MVVLTSKNKPIQSQIKPFQSQIKPSLKRFWGGQSQLKPGLNGNAASGLRLPTARVATSAGNSAYGEGLQVCHDAHFCI